MKKFCFLILCFLLTLLVVFNILSATHISFLGIRIFKVGSGSMEPYIHVHDLIIIKRSQEYNVDDIVTYHKNDEYITHRIAAIQNDEIITKGDANTIHDDPIQKKDIEGKLIYKLGFMTFLSYLISKPLSWILLFLFGMIITIIIPDKRKTSGNMSR